MSFMPLQALNLLMIIQISKSLIKVKLFYAGFTYIWSRLNRWKRLSMRDSSVQGSRPLRSQTPKSQSEADGALGPLEHPDSEIMRNIRC